MLLLLFTINTPRHYETLISNKIITLYELLLWPDVMPDYFGCVISQQTHDVRILLSLLSVCRN